MKIFYLLTLLALLIFAALLFVVPMAIDSMSTSDMKFDRDLWSVNGQSMPDHAVNDRQRMVADLIKSDLLIGRSRSQVLNLLGKGDAIVGVTLNRLDYFLGFDGLDNLLMLRIEFNQDDVAIACNVVLKDGSASQRFR